MRVLPISEVLFTTSPVVPWPILSYAAKWHPGSPDYEATDMQKAVPLEPELSQSFVDLAKRAYQPWDAATMPGLTCV